MRKQSSPYILIVGHGTDAEIAKAKEILRSTNPVELNDHVLKPASERVLS